MAAACLMFFKELSECIRRQQYYLCSSSNILTTTTISRDPPPMVALNHLQLLIANRNHHREDAVRNSEAEMDNLCYAWAMFNKQFSVNSGCLMKSQ